MLPLGKVDPGLRAPETPLEIGTIGRDLQLVEALGYDGFVTEETKDDPFVVMALAAQATTALRLGTSVAIAFPRSPTVTALSAWTLQRLSAGRFTLGLGTQVRGHITRRYGIPWSAPAAWMREYIGALHAVWDCWQHGTPLRFEGDRYELSLMVPLFNPGPIEHPRVPVQLAAINRRMCEVAGEVADGLRPHPVCTPSYIEHVMLPAVRAGAARAGRSLERFSVSMKPLVATAPDEDLLEAKIGDVRARIAFYASTPSYAPAFEHVGLGDLAAEAKLLSKAQRWEELPGLVSDDVFDVFAVSGLHDQIGRRLLDRYARLVTHCEFSIAPNTDQDRETLAGLVRQIQAHPDDAARAALAGFTPERERAR